MSLGAPGIRMRPRGSVGRTARDVAREDCCVPSPRSQRDWDWPAGWHGTSTPVWARIREHARLWALAVGTCVQG